MTDTTTTTKKKTATVKAGTKTTQPKRAARGSQQSKAAPVDPFKDKQGQQIGIGGTAKVPIIIDTAPAAIYSPRSVKDERYPFSELENSRLIDDQMIGPRFFIPDTDTPNRHLATARKRHRPDQNRFPVMKFITRKGSEKSGTKTISGVFVWRAPVADEKAWIAETLGELQPA